MECCGEGDIFRKIFVLPDFTYEISFLIGTKSIRCLRTNISLPSQLLLRILIHPGTELVSGTQTWNENLFLFLGVGEALLGLPVLTPRCGLPAQSMAGGLLVGGISTHTSCRTLGGILNL